MVSNKTKNEKYSWLVDKIFDDYINNKVYSYILQENAIDKKGTVMLVTGYGKSAIAYSDIMYHIVRSFLDIIFSDGVLSDKFIFNISSPQLKLNQQFVHDLLYVVMETTRRVTEEKDTSINLNEIYDQIDLVVNSTDSKDAYKKFVTVSDNRNVEEAKVNIKYLKEYDLMNDFIKNDDKHVLFITSCHKSLYRLCDRKLSNCRMFTYVDEGHLLSIRGNVEGNEDVSKVKALTKLIEKSEGFYVFSATPNKEITKLVNEYNGDKVSGLMPIYTKTPYEAIQEGRIVSPKFVSVRTNKSYITEKMVSHVFNVHKTRTSKIPYHKLLVCCSSFAHIEVLSKLLDEHYNKKNNDVLIFATDSKNGQRCITTGKKYYDVNDFTHDIDSSTQDCIVLHIRQMTAGIDVSSFTGTVKFVTDITTKYTSITQTVGRCVRLGEFTKNGVIYKEDRTLSITDPVRIASRLKDFGDNYIIVPDDYTQADNDLRRYIQIYWGIGYGHITKYHYKESTKKDDVLENEMNNNTSNDTEEAEEEITVNRVQWTLHELISNNRERYLDMLKFNNPTYTRARLNELLSMYLDVKSDDIYFSEFSGFSILNHECLVSLIKEHLLATNDELEFTEQEIVDEPEIPVRRFRTENEINDVLSNGDIVYIGTTKNKLATDEDGLNIQLLFVNIDGTSFFKYNGEKYIVGCSKDSGYKTINQFGVLTLRPGLNIYEHLYVQKDDELESVYNLCKRHFQSLW